MHMKVSPIIWKLDLSCRTLTFYNLNPTPCKKASAVFLARNTIRAYEGEPNNLEVGFKL